MGTAERFLDLGFGGIHYDLEPIYPGDRSFLDLLTRTRTLTLRHGAVLSVAIEQLELVPGTQEVASRLVRNYHDLTRPYLRLIAARVDQVAVMTYDTGLPADWLYGGSRPGRPSRSSDWWMTGRPCSSGCPPTAWASTGVSSLG
jgi:spore germination protein YaaH